jgi:SPP1 gp7 family putative phage head morphogenesis protein
MIARLQYDRFLADEVVTILRDGYRSVTAELNRSRTLRGDQMHAVRQRAEQIARFLPESYRTAARHHTTEAAKLARIEAHAAGSVLQDAVGPSMNIQLLTSHQVAAVAALPIEGLDLGEWWEKQATDMSLSVRREIQNGLLTGRPLAEIAQRIMPLQDDPSKPATWKQARARARTLVRTSNSAVQTNAALATYQSLNGLTTEYIYRATNDQRTSRICASLDGQRFRYKDPRAPKPPQHPNCRSDMIPVLNERRLTAQARERLQDRGVPPRPPGMQDYSQWLKGQPVAHQDRLLGKEGGKAFRNGKTLTEIVNRDQRRINLKSLESKLVRRRVTPNSDAVTP